MADFEPPSFSLGLDLDFEPSHCHQPPIPPSHINPSTVEPEEVKKEKGKEKVKELEDDDGFELRVSDSEPESPEKSSLNRLRRLRRGGPSSSKPISTPISNSLDDDIEDFSDEENARTNDLRAIPHHSSCSSSKFPLSGNGVLARQRESVVQNKKGKHDTSCPSTSLGSSKGKALFSDFTASPLRRFQLLDSDTDPDDPSDNVHIDRKSSGVHFSKDNKQNESSHGSHKITIGRYTDSLPPISEKQDLWKDFCVNENRSVQTPAFDEYCAEYFETIKSNKPAPGSHKLCSIEQERISNNAKKPSHLPDLGSPVPPSHHYFYHSDLKIQELVRNRLPYFCPLSTSGDAGYNSHNTSSIDYMTQFGQDGAKQQTGRGVTSEKSSGRGRKKTKKSSVEDTSIGSGDWINPKQTTSIPKDAGRRRVHADGQSAGRWYTAEGGKKVYVTRDGQQLTGSLAYRHYAGKESGKGFKKFRKKRAAKKK